ncbi:glycoside hydrolase family 5 protein [Halopseudomonas pelagia]|uniref:Endoglucanase n=1 Tax=Halopseudomonas pelagia TaxID=553151 RepID=A0AA91Z6Z0_9GAMM|nr:glycoside hydrolase family 5 protein [Halopseudomonas pelagia]PCD00051.1 endoglucanase [Halopseudomonas pelagia]QFY55641.1 glycoside hydrolase family 5 protein [Halopseudomonas pelagia]
MHKVAKRLLAGLGCLMVVCWSGAQAQESSIELVGLNVAGAEFTGNQLPGKHGTHYFFPPKGYFAEWRKKGITMVRFPLKWERLQASLNAELDPVYSGLVDKMLDQAAENDIRIILDVHNYARYRGKVIGTAETPISAYHDLMSRIAERWHKHPALYAYDIMNEPYGADDKWPPTAQAGIDGIRKHDMQRPLLIEGTSWSSAARWPRYADALLELEDPADNIIFSAHLYIDSDASGSYKAAPGDDFDPMVGVKRAEPFIGWLKQHGKRGHIGEFGVPGDDPRWLDAMDKLLAHLQDNCIPITYWAAGPSWGKYRLSVEPRKGVDQPQWAVLEKYLGQGNCSEYGPG